MYKWTNFKLYQYINKYNYSRWFTYVQIKDKGYKLKNSKGKGALIEFWSVYDKRVKKNFF